MPRYRYRAYNPHGIKVRGLLQARNEAELSRLLERQGLTLIDVEQPAASWQISLSPLDWLSAAMNGLEWLLRAMLPKHWTTPASYQPPARSVPLAPTQEKTGKLITFAYRGITESGRAMKGEMEAFDEEDLAQRLHRIGIVVKSQRVRDVLAETGGRGFGFGRISLKDIIVLAKQFELYAQLGTHVPKMIEAMRIGVDSPRLRNILWDVHNRVVNGETLAQAMGRYRRAFPRFFLAVVEVGERTGHFEGVMRYSVANLKWLATLRANYVRSLRGPFLTLLFCGGFFSWALIWLVHVTTQWNFVLTPAEADVLDKIAAIQVWPQILGLFGGLWVLWKLLRLLPACSLSIDRMLLSMPVVGVVVRLYDTTQFCYLFAVAWSAGLPVEEALKLSRDIMNNAELREVADDVRLQVQKGSTVSEAFSHAGVFGLQMIRAFRRAEKLGMFEQVFNEAYYFNVAEVEQRLHTIYHALRVVILIAAGACVMMLSSHSYGHAFSMMGMAAR